MTLDALLADAAAASAEAMKSDDSAPKYALSEFFSDDTFLKRCEGTIGATNFEKLRKNYEAIIKMDETELVSKVVEKYEAPHLRPSEAWKQGGPSCWSLFNLTNYAAAIASTDAEKSSLSFSNRIWEQRSAAKSFPRASARDRRRRKSLQSTRMSSDFCSFWSSDPPSSN